MYLMNVDLPTPVLPVTSRWNITFHPEKISSPRRAGPFAVQLLVRQLLQSLDSLGQFYHDFSLLLECHHQRYHQPRVVDSRGNLLLLLFLDVASVSALSREQGGQFLGNKPLLDYR